jgi:hypothetical protein
MKNPLILATNARKPLSGALALLLCALSSTGPAAAELPTLGQPPMLGFHTGYMNKKYQFGIAGNGEITLKMVDNKGVVSPSPFHVRFTIGVEETLPDGKTLLRAIKPETLESAQAHNGNFEKTVLKAKVNGDAVVEATFEQIRGAILVGGRVLEPGPLVKNPLRFTVRMYFPTPYPHDLDIDKQTDKKAAKVFEEKIKNDRITMKWTDGKGKKLGFFEDVDATSAEVNGPGIAAAEIEVSVCAGKEFLLTSSPNTAMKLYNAKPAPLYRGFTLQWSPDPAKNQDGKARVSIELK